MIPLVIPLHLVSLTRTQSPPLPPALAIISGCSPPPRGYCLLFCQLLGRVREDFNVYFVSFFPSTGIIYDVSNSYEIAFYVAGAVSVLATCFLFLVPVLLPDDVITVNNLVAEEVQIQSETSGSTSSSKSLIKKLDQLGSQSTKNTTVEDVVCTSTENFLDRYWSMPKRVSSVGSLQYLPGPNIHRSSLLVVEKETQV